MFSIECLKEKQFHFSVQAKQLIVIATNNRTKLYLSLIVYLKILFDTASKMGMKQWVQKLQPIQLYVILILTVMFFITELVFSHLTHALTLLMNAYHMLCNIMALTGCLATIKYSKKPDDSVPIHDDSLQHQSEIELNNCSDKKTKIKQSAEGTRRENKLKNTFGWARIDVMSMLICCIFLASLSFSVLVEALQTLCHMDHFDEMHHPIPVLFIGAAGLLLNGVCYLLIGGYTFHQGSFLYVTESGDVVLNRVVVPDIVKQGGRRLSRTRKPIAQPQARQRQGFREMTRDVIGCILVIVSAVIVYLTDKDIAKYIDPVIAIISATLLMVLSYPHMKESCLILLQTIPGTINIDELKKELLSRFPDVVNVHDFHLWQLTATKIISTVHIIFENHKGYIKIKDEISEFFTENGITQVTIQPEFYKKSQQKEISESNKNLALLCLMQCQGEGCKLNHCCPNYEENKKLSKKSGRKEMKMLGKSLPDLRSIKIINNELSKTTDCLTRSDATQSNDQIQIANQQ